MGSFDELAERAAQVAPLPRPAGRTASPLTELDQRLHADDHALLLEAPHDSGGMALDVAAPLPASRIVGRVDTPRTPAPSHAAHGLVPQRGASPRPQADGTPAASPSFPPSVVPRAAPQFVRAESPASPPPGPSPAQETTRTSAVVTTTVVGEHLTDPPSPAPTDRLNAALARLDRWMEAPSEPPRAPVALTPTPNAEPMPRLAATPVLVPERALPPVRTAEPTLPSVVAQGPVPAARPEVTLRIGRIVVEVVTPPPAKPKLATTPARVAPSAPSAPASAPSAPALPFGWRQR